MDGIKCVFTLMEFQPHSGLPISYAIEESQCTPDYPCHPPVIHAVIMNGNGIIGTPSNIAHDVGAKLIVADSPQKIAQHYYRIKFDQAVSDINEVHEMVKNEPNISNHKMAGAYAVVKVAEQFITHFKTVKDQHHLHPLSGHVSVSPYVQLDSVWVVSKGCDENYHITKEPIESKQFGSILGDVLELRLTFTKGMVTLLPFSSLDVNNAFLTLPCGTSIFPYEYLAKSFKQRQEKHSDQSTCNTKNSVQEPI